jgi:hypothetical protein
MSIKTELDAKVIEILGPDHEVSKMIDADAFDLELTEVLLATFSVLLERLDKLEKRIIQ